MLPAEVKLERYGPEIKFTWLAQSVHLAWVMFNSRVLLLWCPSSYSRDLGPMSNFVEIRSVVTEAKHADRHPPSPIYFMQRTRTTNIPKMPFSIILPFTSRSPTWLHLMKFSNQNCEIRNNSVSIVTSLWLDDRGSIPGRGREFFSSLPRSDRLWGPPSLLSNGYRGPFLFG
jgi:hypothetical protein